MTPRGRPCCPLQAGRRSAWSKAKRSYAMEHVRTALQEAVALFGPVEGGHLQGLATRLVAIQHYAATAATLGLTERGGIQGFVAFMVALAAAQGDRAEITAAPGGGLMVRQQGLSLLRGIPHPHPTMLEAWLAHSRTSIFPVLRPENRARNAMGIASRPSITVSRPEMRPCAIHSPISL